jgi:hypothetical protein
MATSSSTRRGRQSGVDLKPPQAAVVKSNGGERCGKVGTRFRQARLGEASASEPLQKCRNRIRRCQNRGLTLPPGSAWGMLDYTHLIQLSGWKLVHDAAFVT